MSERTAKAVRLGKSLAVILPKDWTRGMNLQAGDLLTVEYDEEVRVRPVQRRGAA